jgi:hypothetical protein
MAQMEKKLFKSGHPVWPTGCIENPVAAEDVFLKFRVTGLGRISPVEKLST